LAEIYRKTNELKLAQKHAELAVLYNPDNIWYLYLEGIIYSENNINDKAEKVFEKLIEKDQDNINYYLYLADIYLKEGDYKNVIKISDKIEDKFGISESVSLKKSKLYLSLNKKKEALQEIIKLSNAFPDNVDYKRNIAEFYMDINDVDNAIIEFNKVLEQYPDDGFSLYGLSLCYTQKNDIDSYTKYMKILFESKNVDLELKHEILSSIIKDSKNDNMLDFTFELSEILYNQYPDDDYAIYLYATIKLQNEEYKLARELYIKLINNDVNKTKYDVWKELILLDYRLQSWDTLYTHTSEAITYFPNQSFIYFFKGVSAIQIEKYNEAIDALEFGLKLVTLDDPFRKDFISYIAEAYYKINKKEQAYKYFDELLAIDSNNIMVLNNYAYYLSLDSIKLSKAEKMSKITIEKEPENSTYLDTYAWILFKQNRNEEALIFIEKAIANDTLVSDVLLEHYGDILYKNNKVDEAVKQWIKAREIGEGSGLLDEKIDEKKLFE
jgi:tetratricopeptide (TPR) repeat protein